MKHNIVKWVFFTWLIWGPIIINSQPGNAFYAFGIDWKADNLDNTMFWLGLIGTLSGGAIETYVEEKDKRNAKKDKERDLR